MNNTDVVDGACLCGAVRFQVTLPAKWVANCHCTMCRRANGAPYVTWVGMATDKLVVVDGADAIVRYKSSPPASREFCGRCGSPLFFRSERWAGEVHVVRAALARDEGLEPAVHAFFSDKAGWVHVDDKLPKRGGKSGTEPLG